ncbi:MAG: DUF2079 domain-containing protein [Flavobacteriales bacterium]|nr:DUF2079 domain-containing protein [Flavobacteriales bacterium]
MRTEPEPEPSRWRKRAFGVLIFFAVIHGLVSFPNHHQFRTYALDLGLYTHALWHYAHGSMPDCSLFLDADQLLLADHFDLYLPLFSPLIYVFGTWTLLVVQWLAVLLGAWGVRRLALACGAEEPIALMGMCVMLLFFGVFAAMAFDYHSNVVAAMLLPWFMLALRKGKVVRGAFLFFLLLISKENLGFWIGPIALLLATDRGVGRKVRLPAAIMGVVGIVWSAIIVGLVMPALASDQSFAHFDYGILGASVADAPSALVAKPWELLRALFVDHVGVQDGTGIKLEFWLMLFVAGGWSLVLQPRLGLMALPIMVQKMWHDDPGKWSVIAHYGIELAPLVGVATALALARIRGATMRWLPWGVLVLSLACTIRFMDRTVAYHDRSRIRIYQERHYVKGYEVRAVHRALEAIPLEAIVSAQSPAVPHLALRRTVYQFPIVREAEYLVFLPAESPYPLDAMTYSETLRVLRGDPGWEIFRETDGCVVLKLVEDSNSR